MLRLKAELTDRFSEEVRRLIAAKLEQEAFLERLILEVAAQARASAGIDVGQAVEVQLPKALVSPEELRRNPLELRTLVAALRWRQRGESAPRDRAWCFGRWVGQVIRHWGEPAFGLERAFP